jgi:hypothetical protein
MNKLVKKSSKFDDNNWALRMADDLEEAARKGQQREVRQKIYVISGKKEQSARDKSGQLIADPRAQKERWSMERTLFEKMISQTLKISHPN